MSDNQKESINNQNDSSNTQIETPKASSPLLSSQQLFTNNIQPSQPFQPSQPNQQAYSNYDPNYGLYDIYYVNNANQTPPNTNYTPLTQNNAYSSYNYPQNINTNTPYPNNLNNQYGAYTQYPQQIYSNYPQQQNYYPGPSSYQFQNQYSYPQPQPQYKPIENLQQNQFYQTQPPIQIPNETIPQQIPIQPNPIQGSQYTGIMPNNQGYPNNVIQNFNPNNQIGPLNFNNPEHIKLLDSYKNKHEYFPEPYKTRAKITNLTFMTMKLGLFMYFISKSMTNNSNNNLKFFATFIGSYIFIGFFHYGININNTKAAFNFNFSGKSLDQIKYELNTLEKQKVKYL